MKSGFLILTLSVVGCAGPRMVPPKDVADGSSVLEVQNRSGASGLMVDESFDLGEYKITQVDRDASSKSGFSVGGFGKESIATGYSYRLQGKGADLLGACASETNTKSTNIGIGSLESENSNVTCECKSAATTSKVVLSAGNDGALSGTLFAGSEEYKVTQVLETDKSSWSSAAAGYRFDGANGPVGAVEALHPGRVWVTPKLPEAERPAVSCLSAGIMLYKKPTKH